MKSKFLILTIWVLLGAVSPHALSFSKLPAKPIENFDLNKYLGTWFEIARIENSFEEGLSNVTATYSLRDDGLVKVVNKGFEIDDKEWDEAEGYAEFAETENMAHLEVTFFWPFYADYVVFEVGQDYEYAFVTSDSKEYLWLLAREPIVEQALIDRFLKLAQEGGFKVSDLIFVPQDKYVLNEQLSEQQSQVNKAINSFEK